MWADLGSCKFGKQLYVLPSGTRRALRASGLRCSPLIRLVGSRMSQSAPCAGPELVIGLKNHSEVSSPRWMCAAAGSLSSRCTCGVYLPVWVHPSECTHTQWCANKGLEKSLRKHVSFTLFCDLIRRRQWQPMCSRVNHPECWVTAFYPPGHTLSFSDLLSVPGGWGSHQKAS